MSSPTKAELSKLTSHGLFIFIRKMKAKGTNITLEELVAFRMPQEIIEGRKVKSEHPPAPAA